MVSNNPINTIQSVTNSFRTITAKFRNIDYQVKRELHYVYAEGTHHSTAHKPIKSASCESFRNELSDNFEVPSEMDMHKETMLDIDQQLLLCE